MPPEPMKQLPDPTMRSRWSPARRRETTRPDDTANARSPSPHGLPASPVAELAAEARRALSESETSAARVPSQPKRAMCVADVATEAAEAKSARLTPALSRPATRRSGAGEVQVDNDFKQGRRAGSA